MINANIINGNVFNNFHTFFPINLSFTMGHFEPTSRSCFNKLAQCAQKGHKTCQSVECYQNRLY